MLDRRTLDKVKRQALKIDWEGAFGGKSKGNRHLFRVTEVAKFLARELGADEQTVEAGALLHDTPLLSGDDSSYQKNKETVKELLEEFNLSEEERGQIAECVASHEGTVTPKTLEAKIVHDADALEKAGILGLIRHTWKLTNLKHIDSDDITEEAVKKVLEHLEWRETRLQTNLAKKIHSYLSPELTKREARNFISQIVPLAQRGVITEKIAEALFNQLNQTQREKLEEQLNLSYLHRLEKRV